MLTSFTAGRPRAFKPNALSASQGMVATRGALSRIHTLKIIPPGPPGQTRSAGNLARPAAFSIQ